MRALLKPPDVVKTIHCCDISTPLSYRLSDFPCSELFIHSSSAFASVVKKSCKIRFGRRKCFVHAVVFLGERAGC